MLKNSRKGGREGGRRREETRASSEPASDRIDDKEVESCHFEAGIVSQLAVRDEAY